MVFGSPRKFHKKFKFVVEIDGFASAGFQKCSELSAEIAKVEYNEGGTLIPDKSPGRVTYTDVTLERGVTVEQDFYDWFVDVADTSANTGSIDPAYKRTVDIIQQDRDGNALRRWRLFNAWPQKFTAGEWDNDADENTIEMLVLTYDLFQLINLESS